MNAAKIKTWGLMIGTAVVAVGATYLYMSSALTPAVAQVVSTGCGDTNTASVGIPLELLAQTASGMPITLGPIQTETLPAPLVIVFDPTMSATEREITISDGMLALPTTFGRTAAVPERISVTCRDGAITTVRYTSGRSASTNFNVTVADATMVDGVPVVVIDGLAPDAEEAVEN